MKPLICLTVIESILPLTARDTANSRVMIETRKQPRFLLPLSNGTNEILLETSLRL